MQHHRKLWRPKFPEVATQCASCPFRIGNHKEFSAVVRRLRAAEGIDGATTKAIVTFARVSLYEDAKARGDFMCHCSVYDAAMQPKSRKEWRQCAGATEIFRTGKLTLP